ncbi:MAG: hypothetical protein ACYS4W_05395 [Planctomycetota bacterium]|jgi:hypothetical protein
MSRKLPEIWVLATVKSRINLLVGPKTVCFNLLNRQRFVKAKFAAQDCCAALRLVEAFLCETAQGSMLCEIWAANLTDSAFKKSKYSQFATSK